MKFATERGQNIRNIFFRPLHSRQATGVFAGKRLRTGLKQQHKQISADEGLNRGCASIYNLRQYLGRPRKDCQIVLPTGIKRQESLADGLVAGGHDWLVVK